MRVFVRVMQKQQQQNNNNNNKNKKLRASLKTEIDGLEKLKKGMCA